MKFLELYFLLLFLCSCSGDNKIIDQPAESIEPKSPGEIVEHTYYKLSYSEDNEQAYWIWYELDPAQINGMQDRTDDFREDPAVSSGSATLEDYKGAGYDRGHLCPAADMKLNKTAMSETFFLSNISPQKAGFNRGIWSKLESQVRKWALENGSIWIATGPIFKDDLDTIGPDSVTVPGYFYKICYSEKTGMIGLILPNASSSLSLDHFVATVDEIEKKTGIDFFSGLDDKSEEQMESAIDLGRWSFN